MDRVRDETYSRLGCIRALSASVVCTNTYDEQSLHEADNLLRAALIEMRICRCMGGPCDDGLLRKVGGFLRHEEARTLGIEAAHRAVQADPENPLALASAAAALCHFWSDYEQALEFADRALSLGSLSSQVLTFCAVAYNFTGQPEKALPLLYEARRLSPRDPRGFTLLHQIAMSHFFSRRFDQAIEWAQRNVTQHPNFTPSRRLMISALAHSGRLEEARDAVRSLLEVQPNANLSLVRTIAWQHPWMVALVLDGAPARWSPRMTTRRLADVGDANGAAACRRSGHSYMPLRSFHATRNGGTKVDHGPVEFAVRPPHRE